MINYLKRYPILFNPSSIIIALLLPTIILVTLPGSIIDTFILISFISSAMLLIIMLENDNPLKVTFLPTMVLLLTTFRLLLSIATTRNIIANEDVGDVIETVGEFVMGGNLISGLLIFVIITIVQFLVVTKGGERVAEVGARFSLDAMPGRQMTIDGDLKNGLITGEQAQKLRSDLSTENKLFGSLDGAMKFVKGDSIAGILISLVNLFGGIYVGINQFELSLGESVSRFSVLTIGDGLVSQIPSLLLSMACGVYLTRIKAEDEKASSFTSQVMSQIQSFWKSLLVIAVLMLTFGILNPNLLYICLILSTICGGGAILLKRRGSLSSDGDEGIEGEVNASGLFETLKFIIKDDNNQKEIIYKLKAIEKTLWNQDIGKPAIKIDNKIENDIEVYISDIRICTFNQDEAEELIDIQTDEFFIKKEEISENIASIANYFLRKLVIEKYNLQYTNGIIELLASKSEVMKNEIDSAIGLNRVHGVIKDMLKYPEFNLDMVSFFESLIHWSRIENEPKNWLPRIRSQAKYEITSRLLNDDGKINVALLTPEISELIESFVSGHSDDIDRLIEFQNGIREEIKRLTIQYRSKPVLIVNELELNSTKLFFEKIIFLLPICGQGDIADSNYIETSEPLQIRI